MEAPVKKCLPLKVRNYHIDAYGHVNNAHYLTFLEEARTVFLEELGYDLADLRRRGYQIFITEVKIKYKQSAQLGDELLIYGWFGELSSRRATWQHEIYERGSNRLVAVASVSGMFLKDDKVVVIPPDIRKALEQLYIAPHS